MLHRIGANSPILVRFRALAHCYTRTTQCHANDWASTSSTIIGWRKRILATLPLAPNQTWIEIGPGHGEMTQFLVGEGAASSPSKQIKD